MTKLMTSAGPCQVPNPLFRNRHGDGTGMRLLFVAGLRGDDLSGVHALGMLHQKLLKGDGPGYGPLAGTIDLYPTSHPMGVDGLGFAPDRREHEARYGGASIDALVSEAQQADLFVHLTLAAPDLVEATQVHVTQAQRARTVGVAQAAGGDAVWLRSRWEPGSLCARMEEAGVPALALHLGAEALERDDARDVLRGLLGICQEAGVLGGDVFASRRPPAAHILTDDDVRSLRADATGLFLPASRREPEVWEGDLLGHVVDPLSGGEVCEVRAPAHGFVLARRRAGVVRPGAELARIAAYPAL